MQFGHGCFGASGYAPLYTLKAVADDIWIVDGPIIRFGKRWPKMAFPTRMTVIRLAGRALFIHSPTPLSEGLRAEIGSIGRPRWVVGPNRLHFWWLPEWREAYPEAECHLASRIREQARGRIDFRACALAGAAGHPWEDDCLAAAPNSPCASALVRHGCRPRVGPGVR